MRYVAETAIAATTYSELELILEINFALSNDHGETTPPNYPLAFTTSATSDSINCTRGTTHYSQYIYIYIYIRTSIYNCRPVGIHNITALTAVPFYMAGMQQ